MRRMKEPMERVGEVLDSRRDWGVSPTEREMICESASE